MAKRKKKLVPANGAEAYKQKFMAADCPFDEGTDEYEAWNSDFDAAADEAEGYNEPDKDEPEDEPAETEGAEEEEKVPASVVKEEYRARYAEAGHPSHCGDELAVLLNNLCLTKSGIDMARFEAICEANDVNLSKYNRTTNGWQGRLRMTGRNLLASRVFAAGGVLKTPIEGAEPEYKMSGEWMTSRRKVPSGEKTAA
jgi:hypothetical protein